VVVTAARLLLPGGFALPGFESRMTCRRP